MDLDESIKSLIDDLKSKGLDDDFIRQQLKERDYDVSKVNDILENYKPKSSFLYRLLEQVLIFIFKNIYLILFGLSTLLVIYWAIFNKVNFVNYFPLLIVYFIGASVIGLMLKGGVSLANTKSNNSFKKSFLFGFLFMIFLELFGLPSDPASWAFFIVVLLIPVYVYLMVFYDLIQSEIFPIVLGVLVVSYFLAWLLPSLQLFLINFFADLLNLNVVLLEGRVYILSE
ncbi:MAG: hypothetical protein ACMXX9_02650 [Candidatus Woesearchaeota archaeon]